MLLDRLLHMSIPFLYVNGTEQLFLLCCLHRTLYEAILEFKEKYCGFLWFSFLKSVLKTQNNFLTSQDRTLAMLRLRFKSLPGAFNACLIPVERNEKTKKGLKATFSSKFDEVWFLFFCCF